MTAPRRSDDAGDRNFGPDRANRLVIDWRVVTVLALLVAPGCWALMRYGSLTTQVEITASRVDRLEVQQRETVASVSPLLARLSAIEAQLGSLTRAVERMQGGTPARAEYPR